MKSANHTAVNYHQYVEDILTPEDVPDAQRISADSSANGLFVLLGLVLVLLHGINLYLFLGTKLWPVIPLLIHLGISAGVAGAEAALFRRAAPALASRVGVMQNGVDADFFSPVNAGVSPFTPGGPVLVFSGAMDYGPNIDAVTWFVGEILRSFAAPCPRCASGSWA